MSIKDLDGSLIAKAIVVTIFVLGLFQQNEIKIGEARGELRERIANVNAETLKEIDEKYVSKEYLGLIVEDIKRIKFLLEEKIK